MAISLNDYEKWLASASANRVFLVLITAYNPLTSSEETFYFSTKAFYSKPTDSLVDTQFLSYLQVDPTFSRSGAFYGDSIGNDDYGTIAINNSDSRFDDFQLKLWRNRDIIILLGDVSWDYDDFLVKPFIKGVIDDRPSFTKEDITFNVLDKTGKLDRELQTTLIGIGSSNEDKLVPDCFGRVQNITPLLIDKATQKYKWNASEVQAVTTIYDKGLVLTPGTGYTLDNLNGEFTLTARPAGDVTLDGDGAKITGSWLQTTRDIVQYIASKELTYPTDFNTTSLDQLDTDKPYLIGYYTQSERVNCLSVIEELLTSLGCFYFIDYDGLFTVAVLKNPAGESVDAYFTDTLEIHKDSLDIESLNWLQYRTFLNYGQSFTVQDLSALSALATINHVDFVTEQYRQVVDTDLSVVPGGTDYFAVKSPEPAKTFIVDKTDTQTEAAYRQNILGEQRFKCSFDAYYLSNKILPGSIINVTYNRYGLDAGKNMQVLSNQYISNGVTKIVAWY